MMKKDIEDQIRHLLHEGNILNAEQLLRDAQRANEYDDAVYYWWGNLHRQCDNWKEALQYYARAVEINPKSPAREARQMLLDIVQFRDMQRYNV